MNGWKNWQTYEFMNHEGVALRVKLEEVYSENPDLTYDDVVDLVDNHVEEMLPSVYYVDGFFGSVIDDAIDEVDFDRIAEALYDEVKGD